ncbi:MAG: tetratricopeptide repeat protein, partial [Candidatus Poribacteria bacterium]|nr:tetratricopeptide repeat protein [Candidatus Poribacteria bacterium]
MKKHECDQESKDWKRKKNHIAEYCAGYGFTSLRVRLLLCVLLLNFIVSPVVESQIINISKFIEAGEYHEATRRLRNLADSTDDIDQLSGIYHQLGEIHYTYTHEYPKALSAYNQVIQLKADSPGTADLFLAQIKKGDVYCRMGQCENAIRTYQTLVDQFPSTHFAHETALQKIHNVQTAQNNLVAQQRVIRTHAGTPSAVEAQFQIAEIYRSHYQLNQPERAIVQYETILQDYPTAKNAPEAQWRIGNLWHVVLNEPESAIAAYRKVAKNYPTSNFAADALFQIARIHENKGQHQQAVSILEAIIEKHPNFWNTSAAFYWLGVCREKSKDYRSALRAYQTFLHVYLPSLEPAYFGQIGKHNQDFVQIETELRAKIELLETELPRVEWEKINESISLSNYVAALSLSRQLIANTPESEYAKKARAQLNTIESLASIQNLQDRISEDSKSAAAQGRFRIGTIYERGLQEYHQAIAVYRQLINDYPKSPWASESLYRIGLIYLEHLDDTEMAIQSHQGLIEKYPSSSHTMMANFQLGEIYRTLHRYDEALRAYQTTITHPERDSYLAEGYRDSLADRARFRIGRVHYED